MMDMTAIVPAPSPGAIPPPGKTPPTGSGELFSMLLNGLQPILPTGELAEDFPASLLVAGSVPQADNGTVWPPALPEGAEGMLNGSRTGFSKTPDGLVLIPAMSAQVALNGSAETPQRGVPQPTISYAQPSAALPAILAEGHVPGRHGMGVPTAEELSVPLPKEGDAVSAQLLSRPDSWLNLQRPGASDKSHGVLERRFADILRPAEALAFDQGGSAPTRQPLALWPSGMGPQVQETLEAVLMPGTPPAETGMAGQGEWPLTGETKAVEKGMVDSSGILANGEFSTGRVAAAGAQAPVVETPEAKPFLGQTVSEGRILDQVVGRLVGGKNHDVSRMSIRLQPEELGKVEIDLTVEQGRIKAQVVTETQQVQEVLERHLPRLREALEQQGLKLDQLQVSIDARSGDGRGFSQQHRHAENPARNWTGSPEPLPSAEPEAQKGPPTAPPGSVSLRI